MEKINGQDIVNKSRELANSLKDYSISDCKKIITLLNLIIEKGSKLVYTDADISPHDRDMVEHYL